MAASFQHVHLLAPSVTPMASTAREARLLHPLFTAEDKKSEENDHILHFFATSSKKQSCHHTRLMYKPFSPSPLTSQHTACLIMMPRLTITLLMS